MARLLNNIDLDVVSETKQKADAMGGHFEVEKHIEGEFHFEGSPMFTAKLSSERATFIVGADEPGILGGRGIYATPLNYLMMGVLSCYASTVALQAGLKGVKIGKLNVKGHLYYDIGPMLSGIDSPLIKELKIEVEADRDIREILEISRKRCPALSAIEKPIKTEVRQV
ncbi:MAG TPA: OsmC family protein [Thermoplasmataceae archaeon]|nr:OsmC family protein [Thermoplasmatales archaeon AK]HLH86531.1 OsmC family protein [Thermoplasmataceae archaeon]